MMNQLHIAFFVEIFQRKVSSCRGIELPRLEISLPVEKESIGLQLQADSNEIQILRCELVGGHQFQNRFKSRESLRELAVFYAFDTIFVNQIRDRRLHRRQ